VGGWFTTREPCGDCCDDAAPACVRETRVSLAVWRCVELEPVLATAGADYARHWRGYIASPCAPTALLARPRQPRLKDGAVRVLRTPLVSIAAIFARVDL
jgi:hypothetical protein